MIKQTRRETQCGSYIRLSSGGSTFKIEITDGIARATNELSNKIHEAILYFSRATAFFWLERRSMDLSTNIRAIAI